jgi:HD-GYP domain-containing protein (c-di-GMP phosphodiesterase class II)
MKLVIYSSNQVGANYLLMHCLAHGDLNAVICSRFDEVIDILMAEEPVDALLIEQEMGCEKIFRYLLSTDSTIPILLITLQKQAQHEYPELKIVSSLTFKEERASLFEKLAPYLARTDPGAAPFCRVPAPLLLHLPHLSVDLFVRLSKIKFVKLVRSGTKLTTDELSRVMDRKKILHLYVRIEDSAVFLDHLKTYILHNLSDIEAGSERGLVTVSMIQDLCHQLYHKLGFTKEMKEIAEINIRMTLAVVGENPELSNLIHSTLFQEQNYCSSHSVLVSYFACSIASKMSWLSQHTFQKLILASLLHDIALPDIELSKIQSLTDIDDKRDRLSKEQVDSVLNHSLISAEVVKRFNIAPGEVDLIVSQHHEQPDGTGFPLGLNANKISPLASVFIVAHDLVDQISVEGDEFEMKKFIAARVDRYNSGIFKKALMVLADEGSQVLKAAA